MKKSVLVVFCLFLLVIDVLFCQIVVRKSLLKVMQKQNEILTNQELLKMSLSSKNDIYTINGAKFYLPGILTDLIQTRIGKSKSFYETKELNEIEKYLPENGVFLDVGANIGNHTLFWLLKSSKKPKHIYSFEVDFNTYNILKKNIEINNLTDKATAFAIGLSDKNVNADYANFEPDASNHTTIKYSNSGNMILKRYDDMGIKDKVDFVKIDTEGHTYEVLKGMEKTLRRDKPVIWAEIWNTKIVVENGYEYNKEKAQLHKQKILDFLHSIGYRLVLDMGRENYLFACK